MPSARSRLAAQKSPPVYAVIIAGGQGTRFWPRSRGRLPKQLLRIATSQSLLQDTARRLRRLVPWRRMLVVTHADQAAEVRRQLPQLPAQQLLAEPTGRNTLPCITLAAEWIAARHADAVMIVAPADHVIQDSRGLQRTLLAAVGMAERQAAMVLIGVKPTRPDTAYGYIELGARLTPVARRATAHWVQRFHEKPTPQLARRFVRSGRFLWNAGIFVWRTSVFTAAVRRCVPGVTTALQAIWRPPSPRSGPTRRLTPRQAAQRLRTAYRSLPNLSVDVGVLEPLSRSRAAARLIVVPADFDWSDIGSWQALPDVRGRDRSGNTAVGEVIAIDSTGTIVFSPDRMVALLGVKDLIVVDSPDALLICGRQHAQDVRRVVQELKQRGRKQYL